jgi:hypothetical protein
MPKSKVELGYAAHCHRVLPKIVKKAKAFEAHKLAKIIKKRQSVFLWLSMLD